MLVVPPDEKHLPFLFRALHSLAPRWHGFSMQLDVTGLDKIGRNGTDVDDCLVLGLQIWLKGDKVSWKQLITAIFQPAGGGNQRLAHEVASSFKGDTIIMYSALLKHDIFCLWYFIAFCFVFLPTEMCIFKPIELALSGSTAHICEF